MKTNVSFEELKEGEEAEILGFNSVEKSFYSQKLEALGFIPRKILKVLRIAPLGDPIQIQIDNSSFCLRKQEGNILQLQRC